MFAYMKFFLYLCAVFEMILNIVIGTIGWFGGICLLGWFITEYLN